MKLIMPRLYRFQCGHLKPGKIMKIISWISILDSVRDQNNFLDNLGWIILISYITARGWCPQDSSQTKWSHNLTVSSSCSNNISVRHTTDTLCWLSRKDVDIIQWKLFIIKIGAPGDSLRQISPVGLEFPGNFLSGLEKPHSF